jgi:hypothetical protein
LGPPELKEAFVFAKIKLALERHVNVDSTKWATLRDDRRLPCAQCCKQQFFIYHPLGIPISGCPTIHEQACFAKTIDISAMHFGVWQKLQLDSCIRSPSLQEQKVKQSLTKSSA